MRGITEEEVRAWADVENQYTTFKESLNDLALAAMELPDADRDKLLSKLDEVDQLMDGLKELCESPVVYTRPD